MATQTINDMSVTWNSGATTFAGIKIDVTDTSSAAASALLDLEVGSADVFYVGKDGAVNVTTAAADALAIGLNGATNPAFQVDASTASMATGVKITGKAAAAGCALAVISSGTNENLTIDAKGSGTVTINGTATGGITLTTAVTASGTLSVAGALTASAALIGSVQSLSGPGAVNVTTLTTAITTTGADAYTLADGTAGQKKTVVMVVDGGDGTLTPSNFGNGTTITFADAGDAVELTFLAGNWWVTGSQGAPAIA